MRRLLVIALLFVLAVNACGTDSLNTRGFITWNDSLDCWVEMFVDSASVDSAYIRALCDLIIESHSGAVYLHGIADTANYATTSGNTPTSVAMADSFRAGSPLDTVSFDSVMVLLDFWKAKWAVNADTAAFASCADTAVYASNSDTSNYTVNADTAAYAATSDSAVHAVYFGDSPYCIVIDTLFIGYDDINEDRIIWFRDDAGYTEYFKWDDSDSTFHLSDDLRLSGKLYSDDFAYIDYDADDTVAVRLYFFGTTGGQIVYSDYFDLFYINKDWCPTNDTTNLGYVTYPWDTLFVDDIVASANASIGGDVVITDDADIGDALAVGAFADPGTDAIIVAWDTLGVPGTGACYAGDFIVMPSIVHPETSYSWYGLRGEVYKASAIESSMVSCWLGGVVGQIDVPIASDMEITNVTGVMSFVTKSGGGSYENAYLYWGDLNKSAGTIDSAYGLYLADISDGTTNYAIYTGLGDVHFGDDVSSDSMISGQDVTVGSATADGHIYFYGGGGNEYIAWDDLLSKFLFSGEIDVDGIGCFSEYVQADSFSGKVHVDNIYGGSIGGDSSWQSITAETIHVGLDTIGDAFIYFTKPGTDAYVQWDSSLNTLIISDSTIFLGNMAIYDNLQVNSSCGGADTISTIYFGNFDGDISFNSSTPKFTISDDVYINGNLSIHTGKNFTGAFGITAGSYVASNGDMYINYDGDTDAIGRLYMNGGGQDYIYTSGGGEYKFYTDNTSTGYSSLRCNNLSADGYFLAVGDNTEYIDEETYNCGVYFYGGYHSLIYSQHGEDSSFHHFSFSDHVLIDSLLTLTPYSSRAACSTAVRNRPLGTIGNWDTGGTSGSAGTFIRYTKGVKVIWSESWAS